MRIALSALGTRGDVQPMLALGLALRDRGHHVRMCAPPDFEDVVIDVGLPFFAVGQDVHQMITETCRDVVRNPLAPLRVMDEMIRLQFDDMRKACEGAEILVGGGVQAAGASIAESLGIPYLYAGYCPVVLRSRQHPSPLVPKQSLPGWANLLSWWATERFFNVVMKRSLNRERARLDLAPVRNVYENVFHSGTLLLATDAILAPPPNDAREGVVPTGYWFYEDPAELEPLDPDLAAFIADGPAPVYVGFGSMPAEEPAQLTRQVVDAILASGQRALLHRGWAGLGDGQLPDQIRVIGSVSHAKLFPRMSAVVHHGGAGTTANALRAGVPQVVVPHILDQFYWAERVRQLGVGPAAPKMRSFDPDALARAIRTAASSAGLQDRAREVAVQIDRTGGIPRAIEAIEATLRFERD